MKLGFFSVVLLVLLGSMSITALGQKDLVQSSETKLLPPVSQPANCSLVLRYLEDALEKAGLYKSNVILIIKMKNTKNMPLARARSSNLKNYIRFLGFKNVEVVVDLESNDVDKIDLHVKGELLYSLPIRNGDKLRFVDC